MAAAGIRHRVLRTAPVLLAAAVAALVAGPGAPSLAKVANASRVPAEKRVGLRPGLQLAAMRTAIAAAPGYPSIVASE